MSEFPGEFKMQPRFRTIVLHQPKYSSINLVLSYYLFSSVKICKVLFFYVLIVFSQLLSEADNLLLPGFLILCQCSVRTCCLILPSTSYLGVNLQLYGRLHFGETISSATYIGCLKGCIICYLLKSVAFCAFQEPVKICKMFSKPQRVAESPVLFIYFLSGQVDIYQANFNKKFCAVNG